jgi:hypothetical protein
MKVGRHLDHAGVVFLHLFQENRYQPIALDHLRIERVEVGFRVKD